MAILEMISLEMIWKYNYLLVELKAFEFLIEFKVNTKEIPLGSEVKNSL